MSGGYIKKENLDTGQHRIVIFTFKGFIEADAFGAWNAAIKKLKEVNFGDRVIAITLEGLPTLDAKHYDQRVLKGMDTLLKGTTGGSAGKKKKTKPKSRR